MRLYRLHDTGEPVRDIQDRLAALGYDCEADARGEFGEGTRQAVTCFQRAQGLAPDGIVGPESWRSLYEAGYRLGDRLLFLRRPMLRGDDVAELQRRLNTLGFDTGKVDGIFGPESERAILEFQSNRNLAEDGVAGPEVITELRLLARGPLSGGREAIREREWMRSQRGTVVGTRVYFDAACRNPDEARRTWGAATAASLELQERGGIPVISRSADLRPPERVRARRANRLGADLIVSLQVSETDDAVYYFASPQSHSEAGRLLAECVAAEVGGAVEGRATPILKETRAPAVVVARTDLDEHTGRTLVPGLGAFFRLAAGQAKNRR
ncbi:MAG: peptidoglycan-binding protein [Acidimicrobiia bacterium]|jgi:N-acetylmuramoyl-L-alanine amidase